MFVPRAGVAPEKLKHHRYQARASAPIPRLNTDKAHSVNDHEKSPVAIMGIPHPG